MKPSKPSNNPPSKNPPKKPNNLTGIQRYDAPAGGWGALKATAQAVADQMRIDLEHAADFLD